MNFNEIVVKESPGLCRCCLSEGCYKDLSSEYTWMNESEVYADMLLECFDISISQQNEGPDGSQRLVCEVCITRLRDACNFKKQVMDSEKKFVDMLGRGEFRPKVVVYQSDMKVEENAEVMASDNEAEVEYLEDDADYVTELLKTENSMFEEATRQEMPAKAKRGRPRKNPSSKPEKKTKVVKASKSDVRIKKAIKGAKSMSPVDKLKKTEMDRKLFTKRKNILYILQYGYVTPFLWTKTHYRCFFCNEDMRDPVLLRDHTAKEHQYSNLELFIYDWMKSSRNKEAPLKIDITNISCRLCLNRVNNLEELIHHIIIAHDAEYDTSVSNCLLPFLLDKDNPACGTCDMKFAFFEYLLRHANKNHLSHDYICDVCGTSFQGENYLKMHNRYYHKEGGYSCDNCGIVFATLSKKVIHDKNVHSINLLTCPHCPETFKSRYLRKLHLVNYHGVEQLKIKCPYCPKVYPQESTMSRHMRRVHLREKNVECEICNDRFFSSYEVKLHMVRHNGVKKFICTVCGKRFGNKSNLSSHMISHTGIKKYVCEVCNKPFSHLSNLKLHHKGQHEVYEHTKQNDKTNEIQLEVVQDELVQMELIDSIYFDNT